MLFLSVDNSKYKVEGAKPVGFVARLWHGIITPITFLISLFSPYVKFYETNNNGGWYDFGFCIGASIIFGSGTHQGIRVSS
jgi:hypothetical protein